MKKINHPIIFLDAEKVNLADLVAPKSLISIKKYQSKKNRVYDFHRPISKILSFDNE